MNRKISPTAKLADSHTPDTVLARAKQLIRQQHYGQALNLLQAAGKDLESKNAKGVCLLRLGQYEAAVSLYREIVFKQGCVWVRPEVPTEYKVNFATALLLSGRNEGGLNVLSQAMDETHLGVQRLRRCIRQWKKGFTLWERAMWMLGGANDMKSQVMLDFEPGLFEDGIVQE